MKEELEYKMLEDNITLNLKHVREFIEDQDDSFKPKISSKVSIPDYAEKLWTHAKIITCQSNNEIVGLSAFYCQPLQYEYAFLSYLAVNNLFRGLGIAKHLISEMIDYCKKENIKGIKTSTWKGNIAVNLYLSFGFEIIETTNNRIELIFNF